MKFAFVIPQRFKSKAQQHRRAVKRNGVPPLLMLAFLFTALLLGMVGGMDSPMLLVIVAGGMFAALMFFLVGFHTQLYVLLVVTFLIQGSLMYFAGLRSATWVAVGMAVMFFCRLVFELVLRSVPRADLVPDRRQGVPLIVAATLFLACFVASQLLNRIPFTQIITSSKAILPMFGVLFAMYWVRWGDRVERIWQLSVIVLLVQLPVVVVQHFVYAVNRNFDSVVGTFGGTPGSGGNSAMLVMFVIIVMSYTVARWDQGLIPFKKMAWLCLIGLAIILLGEVKASFVWLPLAIFCVLRKRVLRNIAAAIAYGVFVSIFMFVTYQAYNILYWKQTVDKVDTVEGKFNASGGYFFDTTYMNYRTGEISRAASIAIWANDSLANIPKRALGYGPGASRPAGTIGGGGSVALRYAPLNVDSTTLAVLLWDTGVLGAFFYGTMMLIGTGMAWRYCRRKDISPQRRALANTCLAALGLELMLLIYNRSLMDEPTVQLMLMFCLGSVVQMARFDPTPLPSKPADKSA